MRPSVALTACPICGGRSLAPLGERSDGVPVLQCERCRMGFVARRPDDLSLLYSDAYYAADEANAGGYSDYQLVATHSLAWVAELVRLLRASGKVLDVGCADGHLLRLLGDSYERFGIEVNERLYQRCERLGIRMLGRDILDPAVVAGRQGELDVVTAIAVLEHVADMRGALERIRDLLATDGVLIFETPVLSATGDNSVWFNSSLEHVFYPTQEGLEHLFQEVFGLPLIGREVPLVDYGSTFVGLAVRGAKQHQRLGRWFRDLLDTPVAELFPPRERRFRLFFDLVHAAVTGPEQVALLAELPASDFTPPLLQRLIGLWKSDAARVAALRQELAQARTGWSAGELALHQERLRASELGREVMRLTAEAAESARREAERTDEVNALGAEVADWRHQAERWQQRSVQLEGEGAQLAAQAGALEGRLAATERRAAELADQGARLAAEAREWELQTVQRESELAEVTARAEAEEARALAAEGREWTIYQMLGVRDFELEAAKARSRQLDTDLQNSQAELAMRGERIQQMLRSTSWRLSAPLRAVGDRTRTMVKRLPVRPGGLVWRALRSLYRLVPVPQRGKQRVLGYLLRRGLLAPLPAATADHPPVPPPALAAPSVVHLRLQPWPASQPLVSVVIPCFNYGRFAAAAVDSVLAQTFQDLEIIVVDGGSDDAGSLAALQELQRPKTTIHFREQRHMVGDNRNFGIARARGKYICCLDPDDLLRPTYLEKALYRLETEGHDVVSTWYERFGAEGGLLQLFDYPNLADMIAGNHVATCAVFRRELWEEAGGFVDTGRGSDYVYEDWRLWIRFATLGARIANLREPLLRYRVHPASLSQGAEVRALPAQREAILALEPAAVGEEAHRRSAERQRQVIEVEDALCNLLPRQADDARPAILLAVPFLLVGGVERLFSHLCAYLRRRGYRIVIVSSLAFDPAYGDSSAWFGDATDEIFHLPRFLDPGRWRAFVDYLLESRRVQILWIVGSAFFYDLLAEIKAAHPELKVIDSLFNTVGHTTNNRKHQRWIDLNLVENQEVEQWLLDAGEPAERIRLIPSGVDLERYRPAVKSEAALAALGIPAGAFVVGYSGRLAIEKRPQRFVALADRLRGDPRLVFLMTGAGPLEGQVRMQIEGLRPGHRLQLLGNVPDVQEVLALYDVLVLPSSLDGRPVVVLESLAMGIPVVASKVGGLPELVRDGESGFLCEPEDFEGCARRIRWLADHPQEHARMKLAARRFAEAALGDTAMCAAYEAILRELLAAAGGDAPPQREGGGSPAEEELGERRRRGLRGETEQRAQP